MPNLRRAGSTAPAILNASFRRIAMDDLRAQCIRALDDHLQKNRTADIAIMTPGIAALAKEATDRIINTITVFDDFCHANHPDDGHDTGSFKSECRPALFKIHHYDSAP